MPRSPTTPPPRPRRCRRRPSPGPRQLEKTVPNDPSKRGIYLCHVYCSLGATKFSVVLDEVKDFLARNPDEVIMLFIGDYISPADTAKEFEAAGLLDRLWTYDTSAPPPTLRRDDRVPAQPPRAVGARRRHAALVHEGLRDLPGHAVHVRRAGRLHLRPQPRARTTPRCSRSTTSSPTRSRPASTWPAP